MNGHSLSSGQCVKGWVTFTVADQAKPVSVTYDPGDGPALTWRIS
jgi:hypothetical protein